MTEVQASELELEAIAEDVEAEAAPDATDPGEVTPAGDAAPRAPRPRPSAVQLLAGAILVVVIVQVVFTWLLLGVSGQVRDQSAIANGLQRCLIQAQLSENTTTDPQGTAYRAAVQTCLGK